jgi:hypothetical protein
VSTPPAPAGASAVMADAPDLPVATSEAHAAAFARLEAYNRDPQLRALLASGDAHAKEEVTRLGRTVKMGTSLTVGGQEHIQHAGAVAEGWNAYVNLADVLGPEVDQDLRSNSPVSPAEHRQARAHIEEMKHDRDFQNRLNAGNVQAKARWSLAHRQLARPIAAEAT